MRTSCRRTYIVIVIRYSEYWIVNQIVYVVHEKLVAELRARSPFVFDVRMVFNSFLVLNSKILIVSCTIRQFDRISAPNLSLENWRMTLEKGATRKCEKFFKARVSGGNQPEWNSLSQDSC